MGLCPRRAGQLRLRSWLARAEGIEVKWQLYHKVLKALLMTMKKIRKLSKYLKVEDYCAAMKCLQRGLTWVIARLVK